MGDKRISDTERKSWFRSSRFFEERGQWFFSTREGTIEGPFPDRARAEERLDAYIRVMRSGLLVDEGELTILPKDD